MRYRQVFACSLLLTGLILAGCSEPPESVAAKKIATKVARARQLMKDPTAGSQKLAEKLLREALATPAATSIAKLSAHELLATLLSESTARELRKLDEKTARKSDELRAQAESFAEADLGLGQSLSELASKAGALAYAAGLTLLMILYCIHHPLAQIDQVSVRI